MRTYVYGYGTAVQTIYLLHKLPVKILSNMGNCTVLSHKKGTEGSCSNRQFSWCLLNSKVMAVDLRLAELSGLRHSINISFHVKICRFTVHTENWWVLTNEAADYNETNPSDPQEKLQNQELRVGCTTRKKFLQSIVLWRCRIKIQLK